MRMEVSGISTPSSFSALLNMFQLGERLLVEVVDKINEGEGTVRVKGQNLHALLETSAQVGEKFWVKVGNLNNDGMLLVREPILGNSKDISSVPQQFQQILERGLPNNQEIVALIKTFPNSNMAVFSSLLGSGQGPAITDELLVSLKKVIPQWNSLSEGNGMEELLSGLKKLGLNYEHRIQQMMNLDPSAKDIEKKNILDTFKGILLKAIQSQTSEDMPDSDSPLAQLLQNITGQQLWFKPGAMESAYILLHLPFLNQEQYVPVQIGIESARKGLKIDEQHCRIAVLVETQELGEIGIDAFFNENSFTCRVLSNDLKLLPELLGLVIPETRERFAKLGFHLEKVETGELDQNPEFRNFLQGFRRSGVDISR